MFCNIHAKVYTAQLFHTSVCRILQVLRIPYVYSTDAYDFGSFSRCRDVFGHEFRLFDIATDYAGVGSEVDESADLR